MRSIVASLSSASAKPQAAPLIALTDQDVLELAVEERFEELIALFEREAYKAAPFKLDISAEFSKDDALRVAKEIPAFPAPEQLPSLPPALNAHNAISRKKMGKEFTTAVYDYWVGKRNTFNKALIRRFQIPPDFNDPSPHLAFRPRDVKRRISVCGPWGLCACCGRVTVPCVCPIFCA